ncbi:hypothetical protein Tco_0990318 [Tanacetum coccineum]|uniref:Uncharacterized protein n=1 Tax=Tanacetum coccineum TaxID=301880 RepID=A0ABQ5EWC3_9ASTR
MVQESLKDVVLAKNSSQPQSSYKATTTLTKFELNKILIDKMDKSESYLAAPEHKECYKGLIKSYDLDKTIFSTYGKVLKKRKTSKDAEPTKSPKAKESQSGSSKGTKSQSKYSGKSVQSEEPEFEVADSDMPKDQEENLGREDEEPKEKVASKRDWFTKPTQPQEPTDPNWNVDKTLYLKEIFVRRANNDPYRFKEGDFPRLRINDIEDMLLLVVQNWLTNLLGDDVSDFAVAFRMFTRSLVTQNRVEDLQLEVESYQKKINVTRPQTTISGIRKRDPYTPYQDPQGFIYVDNNGRNRLMRSDELYKFSDRTLIGL